VHDKSSFFEMAILIWQLHIDCGCVIDTMICLSVFLIRTGHCISELFPNWWERTQFDTEWFEYMNIGLIFNIFGTVTVIFCVVSSTLKTYFCKAVNHLTATIEDTVHRANIINPYCIWHLLLLLYTYFSSIAILFSYDGHTYHIISSVSRFFHSQTLKIGCVLQGMKESTVYMKESCAQF
jgi:hypothetical protein